MRMKIQSENGGDSTSDGPQKPRASTRRPVSLINSTSITVDPRLSCAAFWVSFDTPLTSTARPHPHQIDKKLNVESSFINDNVARSATGKDKKKKKIKK
jgi:hypothetical protein